MWESRIVCCHCLCSCCVFDANNNTVQKANNLIIIMKYFFLTLWSPKKDLRDLYRMVNYNLRTATIYKSFHYLEIIGSKSTYVLRCQIHINTLPFRHDTQICTSLCNIWKSILPSTDSTEFKLLIMSCL